MLKLKALGAVCLKVGHTGWPDRQVLIGTGRHFWIEFKSPTGALRGNQTLRIARLRRMGETVLILDEVPSEGWLQNTIEVAKRFVLLPSGGG